MAKDKYYLDTIVPKAAVLELTYNCNHTCLFCSIPWNSPQYNYKIQPELGFEEWLSCIDELTKLGVRSIAFSGGEPLLKKGLENIISYARTKKFKEPVFDESNNELIDFKEKEIEISIITNGQLVDDYWVKIFKKNNLTVNVSLPGIDTFNELTGGGGDYKKAISAIHKCAKQELDVVVSICVTKKNLHELFKNISFGLLNGANGLLLNRFLPGGRGLKHSELCLTKKEIIEMLDIAEEVCLAANIYGSVGTELPKCIIEKEYKMMSIGNKCSGGVDFFAIDPSGNVRPCNHSPVKLGSFRNIISAIESDYWQKFKCKDFLPENCTGCILSMQCDGGCREVAHIVNGSLNSLDPLF